MDVLKGFRSKDFIEKIDILGNIERDKSLEAIPELLQMHAEPLNDDSIDFMIIETLRTLMSESETETVNGLRADNIKIKKMCALVAGENKFISAGPILAEIAEDASCTDVLFDILSALSQIRSPDFITVFRTYARHSDPLTAALAIETLGLYQDSDTVPLLSEIISAAEEETAYENCSIITYKAIEALGAIGNDAAREFLNTGIHHRNPSARRVIQQELSKQGPDCAPLLAQHFDGEDIDLKIMAANVLGTLKNRKAADVLVAAVDKNATDNPNVAQAIYEALGMTVSMKGIVCLLDGLASTDDMMLISVLFALNNQINPGITEHCKELITAGTEQSDRITSALLASKALDLFEQLYADETAASRLMDALTRLSDPEIIDAFKEKLSVIGGSRADADIAALEKPSLTSSGKRVLAVDDSNSILLFYRSAASGMGLNITTATNGKEGLDCLQSDPNFDLIITDMNMPVMDGIEFTRSVRELPKFKDIPIIMATTESEKSQARLAKNAGVNSFVKKPFTAEVLQNKIKGFIAEA
ncbi:MAG: response regulator [Deltaproteobacteria bacterium]|nr:response regulator [Deltaproteobacteria bacterium]